MSIWVWLAVTEGNAFRSTSPSSPPQHPQMSGSPQTNANLLTSPNVKLKLPPKLRCCLCGTWQWVFRGSPIFWLIFGESHSLFMAAPSPMSVLHKASGMRSQTLNVCQVLARNKDSPMLILCHAIVPCFESTPKQQERFLLLPCTCKSQRKSIPPRWQGICLSWLAGCQRPLLLGVPCNALRPWGKPPPPHSMLG